MREDPTIVGISPGSRHIGVAVLKGGELVESRVRLIAAATPRGRTAKLRSFLSRIIELHRPQGIGLKAVHPSRNSPGLDRVVREVRRLAGERHLPLDEFPLASLKDAVGLEGNANRLDLASAVATEHTELASSLREKDMRRNGYRARLFESVAAARACLRRGTS